MRGRNIIPIMNNNIARTTPGLVYNIHTDSIGEYILDDFGDILHICREHFEIL